MSKHFSRIKLKALLKEKGIRLTKRYGQNLLLDRNILKKIVGRANIKKGDHIFEIGGGLGHLTDVILAQDIAITVFEIDRKLCSFLKERFEDNDNVNVVCEDFLSIDFNDYLLGNEKVKLLSNIPYNITSSIIEKCFRNAKHIQSIFFTVQKDFALRVVASPFTKEYGLLSVFCQTYAKPSILFSISRNVFFPMPGVESCLIYFDLSSSYKDEILDHNVFARVVKAMFNKRRKTVFNALRNNSFISLRESDILKGLELSGIDFSARAETLECKKIIALSNIFIIL